MTDVIDLDRWRAGDRPVRRTEADILREYGVAEPCRQHDVVGLSRYRQRIRRAETLADDRHDKRAWVVLVEKLTAAEDLERATTPQSDADARQKLINAANQIRSNWPYALAEEIYGLAKVRRIMAADLIRLRGVLEYFERENPLYGPELVVAPLRMAIAWFSRPVRAA
jgi:hypothetical protein